MRHRGGGGSRTYKLITLRLTLRANTQCLALRTISLGNVEKIRQYEVTRHQDIKHIAGLDARSTVGVVLPVVRGPFPYRTLFRARKEHDSADNHLQRLTHRYRQSHSWHQYHTFVTQTSPSRKKQQHSATTILGSLVLTRNKKKSLPLGAIYSSFYITPPRPKFNPRKGTPKPINTLETETVLLKICEKNLVHTKYFAYATEENKKNITTIANTATSHTPTTPLTPSQPQAKRTRVVDDDIHPPPSPLRARRQRFHQPLRVIRKKVLGTRCEHLREHIATRTGRIFSV